MWHWIGSLEILVDEESEEIGGKEQVRPFGCYLSDDEAENNKENAIIQQFKEAFSCRDAVRIINEEYFSRMRD